MAKFSTLRRKARLSVERAASCVGAPVEAVRRWERGERPADADAVALLRRIGGRPGCGDFSFIDLFAGIGGLRRGFESVGGRCVFTSEWDRFAQETYRANFADGPEHRFEGDITKVDLNSVPFLRTENQMWRSMSRKFRGLLGRNPETAFDCPECPNQPPEPEEPADAVDDFPLKSKGCVMRQR